MSTKDKELVSLICQDCGKYFTLTYGRFRRLPSDNHWRCKSCNNIMRSRIFANLTDDERCKLTEQRSRSAKKVWNDLTIDEYLRRCESQKQRWAKLSPERKEELMRNTRIALMEYLNRPDVKAALVQRNKDRWNSLTPEDREKELIRLAKIKDEYWDSLTDSQRVDKMMKMWMKQTNIGPTEFIFNQVLKGMGMNNGKDYYWGYNTYPYIHPEYYNIFGKINPVTTEQNIPYHSWDFILFPDSSDAILIDLDGSAHNPANMNFKRRNNTYTERQKIDYNDSQRPYQIPEGTKGYVFRVYDDELDERTPVIELQSSGRLIYKDFLEMVTKRFTQNRQVVESSTTIEPLGDSRNTVSI